MRRREFITILGTAVVVWPLSAHAQQGERMRSIGVLTPLPADHPDAQARHAVFLQALRQLGWTEGGNVRIEARWSAGDPAITRKHAAELIALAPDVILATGNAGVASILQATRSIPVVFVIVPDPVGAGYVESLAEPGGNATGFMMFEYDLSAKWLELLKRIAPTVTRAAVLRDAAQTAGIGQFAVIQSVARSVGIDVKAINLRDAAEIERSVAAFARTPNGGLILTAGATSAVHRDLIISLAARYKLPATYQERSYVVAGGLVSYGPNFSDQYPRAAAYIDRILKGEKPGDLPVQAPTKYELVVNLKTAKALGLTVPDTVLARADEVMNRLQSCCAAYVGSCAMAQLRHATRAHQCPVLGQERKTFTRREHFRV
jgi:putative ABC transport system substrate-binding protein